MGTFIRRLLFGCLWFVAFWFVFGVVGGGLAGARATVQRAESGHPVKGTDQSYAVGFQAGQEFQRNHGGQVKIAAIVCAFLGAVAGVLPGTKGDA